MLAPSSPEASVVEQWPGSVAGNATARSVRGGGLMGATGAVAMEAFGGAASGDRTSEAWLRWEKAGAWLPHSKNDHCRIRF